MKAASSEAAPVRCSSSRRRAGGQHAARVHRDQPVEARGLLHVGGGHQHAHAGPVGADAVDQLPELAARQRIDAGGRLVEDQQVRVVDQRAAQAELLLHAAGELAGRAVGEGRQAGGLQQLGDAAFALGAAVAEQAARRSRRSRRPTGSGRGSCPGPAACRRCAGRPRGGGAQFAMSPPSTSTCPWLDRAGAGDQRQQARLADAVRADQPDHAAGRQVEGDVVERQRLAVAQAEPRSRTSGAAPAAPSRWRCRVGFMAAASPADRSGQGSRGSSRT